MKKLAVFTVLVMLLTVGVAFGQSGEFVETEVPEYGYAFDLPKEFELLEEIDKTTSWMFQPGAGGGAVGGMLKSRIPGGIAGGGGADSALSIYVNWTWMPDVSSSTMFNENKKSDLQNINSPDPDYTDLIVLDGFEGGSAYWYKEVDKDDPEEIHRWHIKMYGNDSAYVVGLTGVYRQFEEWGPIYEEVVHSFRLIPLEGTK